MTPVPVAPVHVTSVRLRISAPVSARDIGRVAALAILAGVTYASINVGVAMGRAILEVLWT